MSTFSVTYLIITGPEVWPMSLGWAQVPQSCPHLCSLSQLPGSSVFQLIGKGGEEVQSKEFSLKGDIRKHPFHSHSLVRTQSSGYLAVGCQENIEERGDWEGGGSAFSQGDQRRTKRLLQGRGCRMDPGAWAESGLKRRTQESVVLREYSLCTNSEK